MTYKEITERLAKNAAVFEALVVDVGDEQARWKPRPEKWSILEVMVHLVDEEREDFRARLRHMLEHREGQWQPIDPEGWPSARRYNEQDLDKTIKIFVEERSASIDWLNSLVDPDWNAIYTHPKMGSIDAGRFYANWLGHDLIHIRQLATLHWHYLVDGKDKYHLIYAGRW